MAAPWDAVADPTTWLAVAAAIVVAVFAATAASIWRSRRHGAAAPATARAPDAAPSDGHVKPAAKAIPAATAVPAKPRRRGDEPAELVGDVQLAGRLDFPHGLVVTGSLVLAPESHLKGDVAVSGNATLAGGARVEGGLRVAGALRLGPGARVATADVDGDATVSRDARVDGRLACERLNVTVGSELVETTSVPVSA